MNFRTHYLRWTASLTLLVVLALTGCAKKDNEAANNTATGGSKTTSESPAASPAATGAPDTGAPATGAKTASPGASSTSGATTTTASNLGVKPQGTNCPADAPIKGNNSKRGKIYHDPKFPDYKKVKPEMCFKDAATAEKAGYTKPKAK